MVYVKQFIRVIQIIYPFDLHFVLTCTQFLFQPLCEFNAVVVSVALLKVSQAKVRFQPKWFV